MMYTVKQVGKMLQVGADTVKQWVDYGELDAIDVSLKRGKKRRLRIPDDSLAKFLERRRVYVPPPRSRRAAPPRPREVIDWFALPKLQQNGRGRIKVSDAAEYLGVKEDFVRRLVANGHLTAVNVEGWRHVKQQYRIAEKELFAYIEKRTVRPAPTVAERIASDAGSIKTKRGEHCWCRTSESSQ